MIASSDVGPLLWASRRIGPQALAGARRYAYAVGRVLERDGAALFTWGEAARLELAHGIGDRDGLRAVQQQLAAIGPWPAADMSGGPSSASDAVATGPSPGPVAIGALAFDRSGRSELVVPRVAVVVDGDERYAILVANREDLETMLAGFPFAGVTEPPASPEFSAPPDSFALASSRPHEDFLGRVAQAIEAVQVGPLAKVVLVREVNVSANRPIHQHHLLERLRALHPSCCTFAVDGFVGASPELLVRRRGGDVVSQPLAGTVARSGDPDQDRHLAAALLASAKERAEHRIVVEAIVEALAPLCARIEAPEVPHLLELRNVTHLATRVTATLRRVAPGEDLISALDLVAALHPTPAVAGSPRAEALDYLDKFEEVERGRFAGPVGWLRADGDGEWWLGLRSALLEGRSARLFAGVGIVAGSDPAAELAETQLKLQAMLAAAVRP